MGWTCAIISLQRAAEAEELYLNGVYLRIFEPPPDRGDQSHEREEFFKHPGIPSLEKVLDLFGEEEPREIDRVELRVTTRAQLRSLCRLIWGKTEPVP